MEQEARFFRGMLILVIGAFLAGAAFVACGTARGAEPPQAPEPMQAPPCDDDEVHEVVWWYVVKHTSRANPPYYAVTNRSPGFYEARYLSEGLARNDAARRNRGEVSSPRIQATPLAPAFVPHGAFPPSFPVQEGGHHPGAFAIPGFSGLPARAGVFRGGSNC